MTESPLAQATCLIEEAFALIDTSPDPLAALLVAEGVSRRAEGVREISWRSRFSCDERQVEHALVGTRATQVPLVEGTVLRRLRTPGFLLVREHGTPPVVTDL